LDACASMTTVEIPSPTTVLTYKMQITFVTNTDTFPIDIDPDMKLQDVQALLEAESGIPVSEQFITLDGRELSQPMVTMKDLGVSDNSMLLLRRRAAPSSGASREGSHDAEMARLQILGNPELLRQFQQTYPELVEALQSPERFATLFKQQQERARQAEFERMRAIQALNADPFDIDAQTKIEEAIRQEAIMENMEHALEYSPEAFGRVTMLYVPVEVNSHPVKAFVDSGAQSTIMSPECAEACGIMRLVDKRFAGIARGVGTAKILGRVHSAQLKLANLHLPCSFTVMEGRDVDLLLGLDMLKAHQACIDLQKGVLRIQEREVSFLPEHQLPEKARILEAGVEADGSLPTPQPAAGPSSARGGTSSSPGPAGTGPSRFPGGGHTLGGGGGNASSAGGPTPVAGGYPESAVQALVGLGASREQAVQLLTAAGGNVDVAASMLFG